MSLIDAGLDNGLEFGHTDYKTGEGRFISHSENMSKEELYINPELTVKERQRLHIKDNKARNRYHVTLICENNTRILGSVIYNPATEALSFSWSITGHHGKKVGRLN